MLCGGRVELLFEPLQAVDTVYVVGGGHVGSIVVNVAAIAGFHVVLLDERSDYAAVEAHPHANQVVHVDYKNIVEHMQFNDHAYVVVLTHGHKHDEAVLAQCLDKPHAYVGCIGSLNKSRKIKKRLIEGGLTEAMVERLYAPIGLEIGSAEAGEIAIAIVAQMMAVRRGKTSLAVKPQDSASANKI